MSTPKTPRRVNQKLLAERAIRNKTGVISGRLDLIRLHSDSPAPYKKKEPCAESLCKYHLNIGSSHPMLVHRRVDIPKGSGDWSTRRLATAEEAKKNHHLTEGGAVTVI